MRRRLLLAGAERCFQFLAQTLDFLFESLDLPLLSMDLPLGLVQLSFGNKLDRISLLVPRGPARWFHPTLRYLKPLYLSSKIFGRLSSEVCQVGKQIRTNQLEPRYLSA